MNLKGHNCTRNSAARATQEKIDVVALSPLNKTLVAGKAPYGKRHFGVLAEFCLDWVIEVNEPHKFVPNSQCTYIKYG